MFYGIKEFDQIALGFLIRFKPNNIFSDIQIDRFASCFKV